jgi:hypothetical protein
MAATAIAGARAIPMKETFPLMMTLVAAVIRMNVPKNSNVARFIMDSPMCNSFTRCSLDVLA